MKKVLVPRVRFKGFSEEWKEERLENIYSFASEGGTPDTNKDIYYKPGLFYFTKIEDMANKYIYHTKAKISELGLKNSSAWIIPKNNILFSNGATIGNVSINKVDLSTKQGIVGMIIKKKFNLEFIYYLLKSQTFQSKVAEKITVGTIPTVAIFNLKKIELFLSKNIYEQQKIGKLLDQISNLITLEQSKLNKLKQLKETLLQKMFPEGNSKTPRIRFKGFEGEWKEEKLEETVNILDNLRIPVKESLRSPGAYKYYGANGIQGKINGYTHQGENILIAEDGANDLNNYPLIFEKNKIWVNNHAHVVTSNNPNLLKNYFLYLSLKKVNFSDYILGTQRYKLTLSNLKEVLFVITKNISEQQKIGDFFCKIDTLLDLYQSKLNKLRQIKEALLQKMFV
ncbi:restriction endonuclease subunit S [Mycoplasmopsis felis]|uniref:restriction endonuclease subunit S n=1 Tax=Mycoplasmopsis felis TaxID=33923 RepID=UPI002AFEC365|nr:restriction endonuclease subunit S [Mycoplasmopsis felis]WQQ03824.1 restriction endonuclease subunit S [Mycoplasmopsis felis]